MHSIEADLHLFKVTNIQVFCSFLIHASSRHKMDSRK